MQNVEATNLEELLERLKTEGVEAAKTQAEFITDDAQREADEIVKAAKKKAQKIEEEAKARIETMEKASMEKLAQSARDLLIGLEEELSQKLSKVALQEATKALEPGFLQSLILESTKAFEPKSEMRILLNPEDAKKLEQGLIHALKEQLGKEAKLEVNKSLTAGFYLQREGEDFYYDFSANHLADELSRLVSPKLREILAQSKEI